METAVPEGLTVFLVSEPRRRRLRLGSALAAEMSEEWETGRVYLAPEPLRDDAPAGGPRGCPVSDDLGQGHTGATPRKIIRHRSV
jgi:hypothetical protein